MRSTNYMTKECSVCGGELLRAHWDIGICAWCIHELDNDRKIVESLPVPSYCSTQEKKKDGDDLPTPEEYM